MKKAVVITEGGRGIGFGHITRCLSLCQALEEKGINPDIIVNGDSSAAGLLKCVNYKIFDWLKEEKKILELTEGAEIVIVDSYLAGKLFYDKVSSLRGKGILVMIDDYNRLEYPRGIVVNPSICADRFNYPKNKGVVYLLGKDYVILRKEFWAPRKKRVNKELKKILIIFGGTDHADMARRITGYIKQRFSFAIEVIYPEKNTISAGKIAGLMFDSDICISGGGQTTYELARTGVPAIGICISENQRMNLEAWQEIGFIEYIGWSHDAGLLENLGSALERLSSDRLRLKMSDIGTGAVDGQGARRIIKEILSVMEMKIREAGEDDIRDLWAWRNHPITRRWSFNTGEISYSEHERWFYKKIREKGVKIYIAENGAGDKIGHARFEMEGDSDAYISVNLNPDFFMKGLGGDVIKLATEVFLNSERRVKRIISEVIKGNAASLKVFEKAGYSVKSEGHKKDRDIIVLACARGMDK